MKTHTVKGADIKETWYVVDATNRPLGRLACEIANVLRGKHRPEFSPHLSLGDHVVVINADKIYISGAKREKKLYYRFSGYPGGLKVRTMREVIDKDPTAVVRTAVRKMLPSTRLGRRMLKKLRVYSGPEHPHAAQRPGTMPPTGY
ncbi:MAG: 50S ribosomal protein L13 [Candidatus Krumholzibacteria bacterium]|nr:50S ribosomal protein L13 [Candidatus Krumholzibacteria bacterium]MDH4336210.1 50S ribosomal protein L13 [Candidatus Krumholzibacteria bacterium]MDH5268851.1 50S ribosomal protein L13 [Candidatus Krumholzibacteria bacterium]